jgi:plasmid stability protein
VTAPASEVRALLLDAAEVLRTKGWTQRTYARDAEGAPVGEWSRGAVCFCSVGALRCAAASAGSSSHAEYEAREALSRAMGGNRVPAWNDYPGRTLDEVLAAFARAADAVAS